MAGGWQADEIYAHPSRMEGIFIGRPAKNRDSMQESGGGMTLASL